MQNLRVIRQNQTVNTTERKKLSNGPGNHPRPPPKNKYKKGCFLAQQQQETLPLLQTGVRLEFISSRCCFFMSLHLYSIAGGLQLAPGHPGHVTSSLKGCRTNNQCHSYSHTRSAESSQLAYPQMHVFGLW